MKKINKLMILFLSAGMILPCINFKTDIVNAQESGTYSISSVSSVKEAIDKLINSKNYTIEVSTKIGPIDINYNIYYTENAYYDSFLGDEEGYIEVDDGAFSFDLYQNGSERNITASNPLYDSNNNKITSIWDANLFQSFKKLKIDEFNSATGKKFTGETKRIKNFFINLFKLNFGVYPNVLPVEFEVGDDVNTLKFTFSIAGGSTYHGKISNFGTTSIDEVDNYLSSGKSYHQNDATIDKVLSLFKDYNYTRIMYDDTVDDYSKIAGYEMYDDFFFYTFIEDDYRGQGLAYEIGMVGIDKTYYGTFGSETIAYEFSGSYYCYVVDDENGNQTLKVMTSFPINEDPFVPNVYNYPTFLKMFKDTQYLLPTGGSNNEYYTSKSSCIEDFVNNFQMTDTLYSIGAVPTGVFVEYYPNGSSYYAGTQGKETVVFKLEVNYYGAMTTVDYVYTDFNTTKVDCITPENVDKYIQDIITKAEEEYRESEGAN